MFAGGGAEAGGVEVAGDEVGGVTVLCVEGGGGVGPSCFEGGPLGVGPDGPLGGPLGWLLGAEGPPEGAFGG